MLDIFHHSTVIYTKLSRVVDARVKDLCVVRKVPLSFFSKLHNCDDNELVDHLNEVHRVRELERGSGVDSSI